MATAPIDSELIAPQPQRLPGWLRKTLVFFTILIALCLLWEGYKAIGAATGDKIPFTDTALPVRSDDSSMPHIANIVGALFLPAQRGNDTTVISILFQSALFTWREAIVGFLIGSVIGFMLGVMFSRWQLLERGLMPYVVASQTIPLLAIAPMIVIWGSRLGWDAWVAVTVISAYLTFFPVTINTLRGLRSPDPTAVELMRSYASSEWQLLWKLRVPAALPYIFTALKISATASVIGAVIGELPSGIADGLGRVLLTYSYYYISGPEKLYAAIIMAALLGIAFTLIIILIEKLILSPHRRIVE
ncbi:MAG TPA: ABC transporter permease [Anaerolineae bacterium]|jgi:NitT/TauT family transport system permease protein|nr:ABC transporter permease [Anaerolineae bacterium]